MTRKIIDIRLFIQSMWQEKEDTFPGWAAAPYGSDSDVRNHRSIQPRDSSAGQHDTVSRLHRVQNSNPIMQPPSTSKPQRKRTANTFQDTKYKSNILLWAVGPNSSPIPVQVETNILPTLLRWGNTERGMILSQPSFRLPMIREACRINNIQLIQALSLRRTFIKYLNPLKSMEALGLGKTSHIHQSATLFEQAVTAFLIGQGIEFCTEEEQRRQYLLDQQENISNQKTDDGFHPVENDKKVDTEPSPLYTPDFIFNPPITLYKCKEKRMQLDPQQQGHTIHWLEAKMFYGASTIPQGTDNAVGAIVDKATKYVQHFGPGAMVFAYGCGEGLAHELETRNVQVLDAYPIDLSALREYQQTWCCNDRAEVLF